jgi:hypothetical protein
VAVFRGRTLPVGRYWYSVLADENALWSSWTDEHSGSVQTFATELLDAASTLGNLLGIQGEGSWVAFEVSAPTPWPFKGFPTIIPQGVKVEASTDVIQAPQPEGSSELLLRLAPWLLATVLGTVAIRRLIK